MNKLFALLLALTLLVSLSACAGSDGGGTAPSIPVDGNITESTMAQSQTVEPTNETAAPPTESLTTPPTEAATKPIAEPTTAPSEITYILNISTKKFHEPSCSRLPTKNREDTTLSREEIIAQNYKPCGYCNP